MAQSARELLVSPPDARPAWAIFDAVWYFGRYPAARARCRDDIATALNDYLNTGSTQGCSPNLLFDEAFYCQQNPDVTELIRAGQYQSGFDHFCQYGHRALSPHWLFDDLLYARLYEDMSIDNLDQHGFMGRYDHYLRSGQFEGRQAHYIFDAAYYKQQAIAVGVDSVELDVSGPYKHYLCRIDAGLPELPPSIYFDPRWYVEQNIGVQSEIAEGLFHSAIEHYLCNLAPEIRDPVPQFSEAYYREANRDIASAIDNGMFRCGYEHFVQFGAFELRRPNAEIDLVYYRDMNPTVRDAFAHLRLVGIPAGLAYAPPDIKVKITEAVAKELFVARARDQLTSFSRKSLCFSSIHPVVSVVMVVFNKFELTMLALASLRNNYAGDIQLILVNNGSSDNTRLIGKYATGAIIHHLSENIGFLRAANMALSDVLAPVTLYLNNDIELGFGALESGLNTLAMSVDIGAVGGKIIRTHGMLQEAGSIIWKNGATEGYMRDALPSAPEVNFIRDVDYCSAVFLLCRSDLLKSLKGFDEDYSPSYYEDVDLCARMFKAGYRTVYDPAVMIYHLEYGSAEHSDVSIALMRRGSKIFRQKHVDFLETKFEKSDENISRARFSHLMKKRVLVLDDTVPLRHFGSGFVRSNDIVNAMADMGYNVSIFPVNGIKSDILSIYNDFSPTVEVLYDQDINSLKKFLEARRFAYDLIWISRIHNLSRTAAIFDEAGISPGTVPFILDTEAVTANRELAKARISGEPGDFDLRSVLERELSGVQVCRHVTAVNQVEMDQLREAGLKNVSILGTLSQAQPTRQDYNSRKDLLFVGSIHQEDSPNLDSLHWYLNEIMPALALEMEEVPLLNFVGYVDPRIDLSAFDNEPMIKIHGYMPDLEPYYNENRIFIAPTRFAAGTPYKIYESAAFGLPCVATSLLADQLGWRPGAELLVASVGDPKGFAQQIARLYCTEDLWAALRRHAIERIERENNKLKFTEALKQIMEKALAPKLSSAAGRKHSAARKPVTVG
ncbi:MAG TPA: glycosyltransferase [Acidocella sp.]|nr:glycosyltransferase [Acidocella sp.]